MRPSGVHMIHISFSTYHIRTYEAPATGDESNDKSMTAPFVANNWSFSKPLDCVVATSLVEKGRDFVVHDNSVTKMGVTIRNE